VSIKQKKKVGKVPDSEQLWLIHGYFKDLFTGLSSNACLANSTAKVGS